MTGAIRKFLIFILAVVAFVGVRLVAEDWFYFPESLAMAFGFFVMGVIAKPLVAPDLPMSRWLVVPLVGMAIGLVILTAPRWYERWAETLPDFLPTEEDFIAQVIYYAEGSSGGTAPRNCGTYRVGEDAARGIECAEVAIEEGRAFYLFHYPQGVDSFVAVALASDGGNHPYRFWYSMDSLTPRGLRSSLDRTRCPDARFLPGSVIDIQCGPRPTRSEFHTEVAIGKDCGTHRVYFDIELTRQRGLDCAIAAIADGEAFHYFFNTDWGEPYGIISGALSWDPEAEAMPTLSYYLPDRRVVDPEPTLLQRACEAPQFRLVKPISGDWRRQGQDSSIEVDCGNALRDRER